MSDTRDLLDDLTTLALQLNRQAFAQPPVEGWLNSFLAMLCERLRTLAVRGVQVVQVIGNAMLSVAVAGNVPAEAGEQSMIDESSPIMPVLRNRQIGTMPNARIYPILVGNDPLGAIVVYLNPDADPVTLDRAFTLIGVQLGPALLGHLKMPGPRTGRLMRQIEMMRSLYEITRNFSSALDSPEILNRAAKSLVETLKIDHVGIVAYNYGETMGQVIAEFPDNAIVGTRIQGSHPIHERLVATRAPVIIPNVDTATDLGAEQMLLQQLGIKSIAVIPMVVQNEVIGSVGLDSYYEYHEFTPEEIEAAAAVTSQLAITAHNAHLYEELKRRAHQLERITELGRQVTSTFDQARIFQIAKEETLRLTDADMVVVALRNPDSPVLTVHLLLDSGPVTADFPNDRAALRFVFSTAEPFVIDDISGSDDADYRMFSGAGMRALATVPLIAGGRVVGAFGILHREPGHYIAIDLAVLEQVGNQLAIALENARMYAQTSQRAETERLMNRLSSGFQNRGDLNTILLNTVQEIAEALNARRARVRLELPTSPGSDPLRDGGLK
ncbi:MAG TPA: GAF domain-containing protein [Aggregatilineales bacterium]|nr:GAF domain-containing protein [Anaerolineales bacterium]HRE48375.1 GAF domain-containing protein [Aggregatilineales bacterium]